MEIAIYGKGGIGKSTIAANISVALAKKGKRVLQIGCDPKHDSTRLINKGERIKTALEYIKETGAAEYRIEEILKISSHGIGCIEAGGPEPGVGCAGRGIITVFELLDDFNVKENYEMVVYDVLGDVVCGGFAVPIRSEYADTIFLVTSGEYMAIYAANNILRGIKNYDKDGKRVAGIIYNKRNIEGEDERLYRFSNAVGLPICATIPRSDAFTMAEKNNCTLMDMDDAVVKKIFEDLASKINDKIERYYAKPLTDELLEKIVLDIDYEDKPDDKPIIKGRELRRKESSYLSKNVLRDEPLHGCAFNGAVSQCVHLKDVAVLVHGPRSCSYLAYQTISSSGRRSLYERGALLPVSIVPNMMGTDMDENEMVFGGMDKLRESIEKIREDKPKAIIVVSTCPSGIIGDDIEQFKDLSNDIPVITLKTDGNLSGDYLQGMLLAFTSLAEQIINKDVIPKENLINIIFEKVVAKNTESNFLIIKDYLDIMGLEVNCRFLCNTNYDSLKNFKAAALNLMAYKDYTSLILKEYFEKNYEAEFFDMAFPVGFQQTCNWLMKMGSRFGKSDIARRIIEENQAEYRSRVDGVRASLKGKKLMVITYNHQIDWILGGAIDAGVIISKVCILNFSQDEGFRSDLDLDINFEENYDISKKEEDLLNYRPDILLTNYEAAIKLDKIATYTIPMCPDVGFFSGISECEKWTKVENSDINGDWKNDEELFRKYYA